MSVAVVLRWTARVLSAGLVFVFCIFALGEGLPARLKLNEALLFACLALCLGGLLTAWRLETIGGILALLGAVGFYATELLTRHRLPGGWILPLLLITPLLFLLAAWFQRLCYHPPLK